MRLICPIESGLPLRCAARGWSARKLTSDKPVSFDLIPCKYHCPPQVWKFDALIAFSRIFPHLRSRKLQSSEQRAELRAGATSNQTRRVWRLR